MKKVELEKEKQDDTLDDLSSVLGDLKGMSSDMGSELDRTAAGTIQHFANNTCSVYITYSKEDEAVRSIQAVHGFVLEGRPLRY
ncbi:hypothetical protein L1987_21634 [Smallanthus sonchifolius]|uniref:Uncharacterized protein n=1 Tax=Smallanthus sonchifolius TaxID=185202 RepID=A0ACB9IBW5_9ASTR|nr:hypothetical protein L1987_21634 [Smallanthus sonchifolius]